MKNIFRKLFAMFYGLQLILSPVFAETPATSNLPSINDIKVSGNDIAVEFSQLTDYQINMLSNPPRLVMEIPETQYKAAFNRKEVTSDLVKRVRGYQFKENPMISRVILDLKHPVNYKANPSGNEIIISLSKNEVSAEPAAKKKE